MNQYHNTLYWCLLCWDLKKFKGQSIKISVTQQYKAGRQALRSLYSSINVTKNLLLLQPQSKLQLLGKTPDAEGAQEAAGSTHASLWTTAWTLQNPRGHSCLKDQHFCEPLKSELNPSYSIPLTATFSQNELQIFCTLSEGEKIKKKGLYSSHALAFHELCYKLSI